MENSSPGSTQWQYDQQYALINGKHYRTLVVPDDKLIGGVIAKKNGHFVVRKDGKEYYLEHFNWPKFGIKGFTLREAASKEQEAHWNDGD